MRNKYTERYIVTVMARKNGELYSKLYALGFTGFDTNDMIPILCEYDDNDVWTFEDIKTAKEIWSRYKNRLFERYGERIRKHDIFISKVTLAIEKVEEIGER